jgi:hypothetical protein
MTIIKKKSKRKDIARKFEKAITNSGVDTKKYCGVIRLSEDPLQIQKKLRDEWE